MSDTIPHDIEAEKALLSSYFIAPLEVGSLCAETINHNFFFNPCHQIMYSTLAAMWQEQEPIDLVTVCHKLSSRNQLGDFGGPAGVAAIHGAAPTAANARYYVDILREKYALREIVKMGRAAATKAMTGEERLDSIIREMEACLTALISPGRKQRTNKDLMMEIIAEIQDRVENRNNPKDVTPTGFTELDRALAGGMRPDDFILVTGPTKGGKSVLAQNIAEHVWRAQKRPVAIFSLEMGEKSYMYRVLASTGNISSTRMRSGWINEGEFGAISRTAPMLADSKIFLREDCFTIAHITAAARQYKAKFPDLGLIVVDYLQLIDEPQGKSELREQVVARMSTSLRRLNLQLGVPMLFLSQENESGQARESRRLEQDCTMRVKIAIDPDDAGVRNISIPLSRNGPTCEFPLTFLGEFLSFRNHATDTAI